MVAATSCWSSSAVRWRSGAGGMTGPSRRRGVSHGHALYGASRRQAGRVATVGASTEVAPMLRPALVFVAVGAVGVLGFLRGTPSPVAPVPAPVIQAAPPVQIVAPV